MNTSFISTKQIKDLVNEQNFTSTQDIMECMKGMFADVLEQTLQAEMDLHLGYDRAERTSCEGKKNYRNGTVKRTMKTQLGEVGTYHVIVTANLSRRSLGNIREMPMASRSAFFLYMQLECPQEISKIRLKDFMM